MIKLARYGIWNMGDQAENILRTLNMPNDASYDNLKQSLDRYFGVRRNLIIEQAKFNRRVQQQGESVDVFIQDLYRLVEHCRSVDKRRLVNNKEASSATPEMSTRLLSL